MGHDATGRRRWFGALALSFAVVMLVCGLTLLKGRLQDWAFITYWVFCLVLTALALMVALWDVRALQQHTRQQQRDLLENTLKEIETDARNKGQPPGKEIRKKY